MEIPTPFGRRLIGDYVVYDVDKKLLGDFSMPLKATTLAKYQKASSEDSGLKPPEFDSVPNPSSRSEVSASAVTTSQAIVSQAIEPVQFLLGRTAAVNEAYICYTMGINIQVIKKDDTKLKATLEGHTERITDMAFCSQPFNQLASISLDGNISVWYIDEMSEGNDLRVRRHNLQIPGVEGLKHPRLCWFTEGVLAVSIDEHVLLINIKIVAHSNMSSSPPSHVSLDNLFLGVYLLGKHNGEVTDLSITKSLPAKLVSSSYDGEVKIWQPIQPKPLSTFTPHGTDPVYSVTCFTSPERPDDDMLITGGPLNREIKIWIPNKDCEDGNVSWRCTQTLDMKSSSKSRAEEAFFNHVTILSEAGLILLANAKRNAIYAVRLDYGSSPVDSRMVSLSEFTLTIPILSCVGTIGPPGEATVTVYCQSTHAYQQYTLDLCLCSPPPIEFVLARFQEEMVKNGKALHDSTLQMVEKKITEVMATFEESCKKEIQETVSSSIKEFIQTGISDQAFTHLTQSMSKAIQDQYQTSGKQAIQESLKSNLESSVIPSLERSCEEMLTQVKSVFKIVIEEHTSTAHQKFFSGNSQLADTLRETTTCTAALSKALSQFLFQVRVFTDPKKELESLITECKYEESFTLALRSNDVSLVSWLCSKVNLHKLDMTQLSQCVLLSLLSQLAYDISKDTDIKLAWIDDIVAAIDPDDQSTGATACPIYDDVHEILSKHCAVDNRATKNTMQYLRKYSRISLFHGLPKSSQ